MKTTDRGIDMIKGFEGLRLDVYIDSASLRTVGYGHLVQPHDLPDGKPLTFGDSISREAAETFLRKDIKSAERVVVRLFGRPDVGFEPWQIDALVSLAFNCPSAFDPSTGLYAALVDHEWGAVPEQIRRWCFAKVDGKKRKLPGLVARREVEARLFETGRYPEGSEPPAPARPTLRRGDEDPSNSRPGPVSELQRLLNLADRAGLNECGVFSGGTENAVRAFQKAHGLDIDGIVGPLTYKALDEAQRGAKGRS